jgi:hypothetical protein
MDAPGHGTLHEPLQLGDALVIHTDDERERTYTCVAVLEDPDDGRTYTVLMWEGPTDDEHEFIVADAAGNLLEDDDLAQEILDEFLLFAEEAGEDLQGEH